MQDNDKLVLCSEPHACAQTAVRQWDVSEMRMTDKDTTQNQSSEDDEDIGDNIAGKNLDPEAVQIAVVQQVRVGQCWQANQHETRWNNLIDINKGDGDVVEIWSRLVATDLKVHQVKMGILRDDTFGAAPPSHTMRLLFGKIMTRSNQTLPHTSNTTSAHRVAARTSATWLVWTVAQEHVRSERCSGEFRIDQEDNDNDTQRSPTSVNEGLALQA